VEKLCIARQATDHNIIQHRPDVICMLDNGGKNTNPQSKYLVLSVFPQKQWLSKHTSMLHYAYTACLVTPFSCLQPGRAAIE
jgi:hypothetical protein